MIGDEVTVTVLRVKGNQVRLGVNAPKSISVQREEIFQRIKRERRGSRAAGRPRPSQLTSELLGQRVLCPGSHPFSMIAPRTGGAGTRSRRDGRVVEGAPLLRV